MIRNLLLATTALALCACNGTTQTRAETQIDLSAELVPATADNPPDGPEGACWARDLTPAIIETVTEQVMVKPAKPAADGTEIVPASFRTITRQNIVQDRSEVWFRTPCETEQTVTFIATLQRALKARGYYDAPVTGTIDRATRVAIRRYQEPRGLDSEILSLGAARDLGILAVDIDTL
jgi:hypothetical protein